MQRARGQVLFDAMSSTVLCFSSFPFVVCRIYPYADVTRNPHQGTGWMPFQCSPVGVAQTRVASLRHRSPNHFEIPRSDLEFVLLVWNGEHPDWASSIQPKVKIIPRICQKPLLIPINDAAGTACHTPRSSYFHNLRSAYCSPRGVRS